MQIIEELPSLMIAYFFSFRDHSKLVEQFISAIKTVKVPSQVKLCIFNFCEFYKMSITS